MATGFLAGSIYGMLQMDKSQWDKSVSSIKSDETNMKGVAGRIGDNWGAVKTKMTIAGAAITGFVGLMIKQASDAEETYAKFGTVFKDVFDKADQAAENLASSYGLSELAARDMLGATGDLLTGLGMMPNVALDISEKTQQLAVDLASFTNYSGGAKGASEAITKAMLGEREAIKSLGIVITEEMVKERLHAQGKDKLTGLALQQAKAEVTLAIAYEQSKNAVGDFSRTQDSFANQTRILRAELSNVSVTLGQALLPMVTSLVKEIVPVVKSFAAWAKEHPSLTKGIMSGVAALGAMLLILPRVVSSVKALGVAMKVATGPVGLITAAIIGAGIALNKWIDARKKAMDADMEAMRTDKTLAEMHELRRAAIEKGIMTQQQWAAEVNKFGKDYKAFLTAVSTAPEYEALRGELEGIREKQEDVGTETEDTAGAFEQQLNAALDSSKEKIKTWTDYLKDHSIPTIKDKEDRVKTLEGYLRDLEKAYDDGKISAEDYKDAQQLIHDELVELGAASKTYYDHLKDMGIPTLQDEQKEIDLNLERLEALNTAKTNGVISAESYKTALAEITSTLEKLAPWIRIVDGEVKILGKDFDALVPPARNLGDVWDMVKPKVEDNMEGIASAAYQSGQQTESAWAQASERIRDRWTTDLGEMLRGAKSFGDVLDGVWDTIVTQFTDMGAQLLSKWTFDIIGGILGKGGDLISGIGSMFSGAATEATGAMGGATQSVLGNFATMAGPLGIGLMVGSMIGFDNISNTVKGVWNAVSDTVINNITAIGEVGTKVLSGLGDLLGGILSGLGGLVGGLAGLGGKKSALSTTDSWHLEHIWINTQELRNYMFDVQRGFITAIIPDLIMATKVKLETVCQRIAKLKDVSVTSRGYLNDIKSNTGKVPELLRAIEKAIKENKPKPAQTGLVSTMNELVELHGSPAAPEYVLPHRAMTNIISRPAGGQTIDVDLGGIHVHLDGVIITDRDYARDRFIPEFIAALRANVGKAEIKEVLGLT